MTDLIEDAQKTLAEHGDIPVVVRDPGCGCCASSTYEEAGTHVEKDEVRVWGGSETITAPLAYVVS
ncbi:hypothetical protein ACIQPR_43820 [Streptomyces sp. NPDC091280]|uniref:hypothetical protein n=1 Tax=Streptomyces sp. NPDC091280 TaxID=3365984 RepID=UPI00380D7CDB